MTDKSSLHPPLEVLAPGMLDMLVGSTMGENAGVAGWLKMSILEIDEVRGISHCAFTVEDEHLMYSGYLHGACLATLVDTAMSLLVYPFVPVKTFVSTANFSINYLKSVKDGVCDAYSTIEFLGKSAAVVTTRIENNDRLVAIGTGTVNVKRAADSKVDLTVMERK